MKIMKKIGKLCTCVAYTCVFSIVLLLITYYVSYLINDGNKTIFGYHVRIVMSESMQGENDFYDGKDYNIDRIEVGAAVVISEVSDNEGKRNDWYGDLKVGDVLTFRYDWENVGEIVLTHRLIKIEAVDNDYILHLQGDHPEAQDEIQVIRGNDNVVIGKVTGVSNFLGKLIAFLQKPIVLVVIVLSILAILISQRGKDCSERVRHMDRSIKGYKQETSDSEKT